MAENRFRISKGRWLLILGILLVVVDQVIKLLVKSNMTLGEHFSVFGNWFQILFIENEGMAFGMKFGGMVGKFVLTAFRVALFGFLCWWITRLVRRGRPAEIDAAGKVLKYAPVPTGVLVGLTLITAGALGNIVDCLLYGQIFSASTPYEVAQFGGNYAPVMFGKVVDMFYFPLFQWENVPRLLEFLVDRNNYFFGAVFNLADAYISVAVVYLLVFQFRFFSK